LLASIQPIGDLDTEHRARRSRDLEIFGSDLRRFLHVIDIIAPRLASD
jgi:hypothetical protein